LFTAMIALFLIYAGIQWIVMAVLANPAGFDRPLADAARIFLGPSGAVLMAVGALVSVYGYLSANVLNAPRLTFALAARHDFPPAFAWLHPRYHTPYLSILAFVGITWLLAVRADFRWNAQLSGVTRLFTYGSACLALIVLRRRRGAEPAAFRLPAGDAFAVIGVVFCLGLMTGMGWIHLLIVGVTRAGELAVGAQKHHCIDVSTLSAEFSRNFVGFDVFPADRDDWRSFGHAIFLAVCARGSVLSRL
jgi:basic amino acid/polyamine antiporter, APA family